jgi:ABC-type proline/glycine betaine transport system substrate-binding protein
MRIRGKRSRALVITAVALALAAGCSSRGTAGAGAPQPEKTDLNVAVVPALDSAGFFVALYGGLFKAQGLNVHFTPATSSETVIADQVKGQFDITLGNYVSYIQAQQRRAADLYIFAEASVMGPATQGIYTMPDSMVTDLSDLAGQTIAIAQVAEQNGRLVAPPLATRDAATDRIAARGSAALISDSTVATSIFSKHDLTPQVDTTSSSLVDPDGTPMRSANFARPLGFSPARWRDA